jgi:hypothetical protein
MNEAIVVFVFIQGSRSLGGIYLGLLPSQNLPRVQRRCPGHHPPQGEHHLEGGKLVEAHEGLQHLRQRIETTGMAPGLLEGLDVL